MALGQSRLNSHPLSCGDPIDLPENIRCRVSLHAEHDALRRCRNTKRATISVARIGRNGQVALAKPCLSCMEKISDAGIRRVLYTVDPYTFSTMKV